MLREALPALFVFRFDDPEEAALAVGPVGHSGQTAGHLGLEADALRVNIANIGDTRVWVLPNPSGLNAHYQLADLARLFAQLRSAADADQPCDG